MAKRQNFEIKVNGELLEVKHAWNASIRFIESYVGAKAKERNEEYNLIDVTGEKNLKGFYTGSRVWESKTEKLTFTINLIEESHQD